MSLFRPEVLQPSTRLAGKMLIHTPRSLMQISCALVTVFIVIVLWLMQQHFARTITTTGQIQTQHPVQRVHSPVDAVVQSWHVAVGQEVTAGDTLVTLVHRQSVYQSHWITQQRTQMQGQITALQQRIDDLRVSLTLETGALERQRQLTYNELALLTPQVEIAQQLVKRSEARITKLRAQPHMALSQYEFEQFQDTHLQAQQQLDSLTLKQTQLEQHTYHLSEQITLVQFNHDEDMRGIEAQIKQHSLNLQQLTEQSRFVIKAERDGIIDAVMLSPHMHVAQQQLLLSVVPKTEQLQVELILTPSEYGQVAVGQVVHAQVSGFPIQEFGQLKAQIYQIQRSPEINGQQVVHRVLATIIDDNHIPITIGMVLQAHIRQQRLTLWQWLIKPLQSSVQQIKQSGE